MRCRFGLPFADSNCTTRAGFHFQRVQAAHGIRRNRADPFEGEVVGPQRGYRPGPTWGGVRPWRRSISTFSPFGDAGVSFSAPYISYCNFDFELSGKAALLRNPPAICDAGGYTDTVSSYTFEFYPPPGSTGSSCDILSPEETYLHYTGPNLIGTADAVQTSPGENPHGGFALSYSQEVCCVQWIP